MNAVKEGFLEEAEFKGTVGKGNSKVFQTKRGKKTNKQTGNKERVYVPRADSSCRVETETIL